MAALRSSYTQSEFRDLVKGDMGMRASGLITDVDLNFWGRRGQRIFAYETGWYYRDAVAVITTADVSLYSFPADAISVSALRYQDLPLYLTTVRELERRYLQWRTVGSGTPTQWFRRGMTSFGIYPAPSASGTTDLKVDYTALPPNPTGDADTYYIPTALDEALLAYGKMRAAEKDASGEGARRIEIYRADWLSYLRQGKALVEEAAEGEPLVIGADADSLDDAGGWWSVGPFVAPTP